MKNFLLIIKLYITNYQLDTNTSEEFYNAGKFVQIFILSEIDYGHKDCLCYCKYMDLLNSHYIPN